MLGCMMDRTRFGSRMTLPFFGQATCMPLGPAKLACRAGAAVVLGFSERLADDTTQVVFKRLSTDGIRDPRELTRRIGLALEHEVRSRPEQWLWIFRRHPRIEEIQDADGPDG
jgi:lauroyl/myristoyl acyltransferase